MQDKLKYILPMLGGTLFLWNQKKRPSCKKMNEYPPPLARSCSVPKWDPFHYVLHSHSLSFSLPMYVRKTECACLRTFKPRTTLGITRSFVFTSFWLDRVCYTLLLNFVTKFHQTTPLIIFTLWIRQNKKISSHTVNIKISMIEMDPETTPDM